MCKDEESVFEKEDDFSDRIRLLISKHNSEMHALHTKFCQLLEIELKDHPHNFVGEYADWKDDWIEHKEDGYDDEPEEWRGLETWEVEQFIAIFNVWSGS